MNNPTPVEAFSLTRIVKRLIRDGAISIYAYPFNDTNILLERGLIERGSKVYQYRLTHKGYAVADKRGWIAAYFDETN